MTEHFIVQFVDNPEAATIGELRKQFAGRSTTVESPTTRRTYALDLDHLEREAARAFQDPSTARVEWTFRVTGSAAELDAVERKLQRLSRD